MRVRRCRFVSRARERYNLLYIKYLYRILFHPQAFVRIGDGGSNGLIANGEYSDQNGETTRKSEYLPPNRNTIVISAEPAIHGVPGDRYGNDDGQGGQFTVKLDPGLIGGSFPSHFMPIPELQLSVRGGIPSVTDTAAPEDNSSRLIWLKLLRRPSS